MKTTLPNLKTSTKAAILCMLTSFFYSSVSSQALSSPNGLNFQNPTLITPAGTHLTKGAIYRFNNVMQNVNATVRIDTLVSGAEVKKIDDDNGGLGYTGAFQPEIKIPSGSGQAYAQFTITFFKLDNTTPEYIDSLRATPLDVDGNLRMKEFAEVNMNGGAASYMSTSLDISVLQVLLNRFRGENVLGIERDGIDTAAFGNMFTVRRSNVHSFSVKYGATTLLAGSANRQYSLYMKGFQYPDQIVILPVKLESFTAMWINNTNKVDLKWITSSEKNASHFVVEKSTDGKNYSDVGTVFAFGNTSEKMTYTFTDNIGVAQANVTYYRLRTVDADGKLDYSMTRIIRSSKQNTTNVTILTYPNPVINELRITIPSGWQGKQVTYEIVNANAQAVKKINAGSGSQTETVDISKLAPGFYVVNVNCGAETAQQKIIKK
jgi:hypothetical protein